MRMISCVSMLTDLGAVHLLRLKLRGEHAFSFLPKCLGACVPVMSAVAKQPWAAHCMTMRTLQDINGFPAPKVPCSSCAAIFVCGQEGGKRCVWLHPVLQAQRKHGEFHQLIQELRTPSQLSIELDAVMERVKLIDWFLSNDLRCACYIQKSWNCLNLAAA